MKNKNFLSMTAKILGVELICHVMCILTSFSILTGFNNMVTRFLTLAINCAIYYSLIFSGIRKEGQRDRNRVDTGHMKENPLKGLYAALIAESPFILLGILLILAKCGAVSSGIVPYFRFANTPYMTFYASLMPPTMTFAEVPMLNVIISALTTLFMPGVAGFAYAIGLNSEIKQKAAKA